MGVYTKFEHIPLLKYNIEEEKREKFGKQKKKKERKRRIERKFANYRKKKGGKRLKYRSKYRCINGGRKIKMLEFGNVGGRVGFSTLLTV